MSAIKRNLANKIESLLSFFPAVVILGVRQCGKTVLASSLRPNWKYFDLEQPSVHERISSDPEFFFRENPENLILDEAQEYPDIFKALRGAIDANRDARGRFIITGSSSWQLLGQVSESLAGRVGIVELGTLKTNEAYELPLGEFYSIFNKPLATEDVAKLKTLSTTLSAEQLKQSFLRGGYPEPVLSHKKDFQLQWMDSYFKSYLNRDVRQLFPGLNNQKFRRFLQMLSSLHGQIINKAELGRSLEISETTAADYLKIAEGTYVWRNFPSFDKDTTRSLVKMPRGAFRDCGLQNFLLRITEKEQLESHPYVGRLFEAFIVEEIIKGIQATTATALDFGYFRTKNGAEIDLIAQGSFGVLPIEVKLGTAINSRKLISLRDFVRRHKLPFGILVNNGDEVCRLSEEIIQVPATYL